MIYVSRSFPAEVGERRDKDTREKFQRSLRTTQHTQQTRAFTLVVRSHRFGSSSLIFYVVVRLIVLLYIRIVSLTNAFLCLVISLSTAAKVSVPFKTTRASFRFFTKLSVIIDDDAKERSVMCCLKKNERNTREREKNRRVKKKRNLIP